MVAHTFNPSTLDSMFLLPVFGKCTRKVESGNDMGGGTEYKEERVRSSSLFASLSLLAEDSEAFSLRIPGDRIFPFGPDHTEVGRSGCGVACPIFLNFQL